jgi:hypothetical protein
MAAGDVAAAPFAFGGAEAAGRGAGARSADTLPRCPLTAPLTSVCWGRHRGAETALQACPLSDAPMSKANGGPLAVPTGEGA